MRKVALLGGVIAALLPSGGSRAETQLPAKLGAVSTIQFRPTLGFSTGYDSNPEEFVDGDGSALKRLDAGFRMTLGDADTTRAVASFSGSVVGYDSEELDRDYQHSESVELSHRISPELRVAAGVNRNTDGSDDPVTKAAEAWTRLDGQSPHIEWTFRATIADYREEVSARDIREFELEDYDYVARAGVLRTEFARTAKIRPVVELGVASLDYAPPLPVNRDRDAFEHYFIAGAEVDIAEALRLRLGLRRNERKFDQAGDGSVARWGPDIAVNWDPSETLGVQFAVRRTLQEPSREDTLVEDVLSAEIKGTLRASERLSVTAGASVEHVEQVGADDRDTEISVFGDARYRLNERLILLVEGLAKTERFQRAGVAVDRTAVRVGVEATF